ncbi:hypothetical protein BDY19DRAFT_996978 [Irpex rosettiformis]|uniref:Uncharacterized protein n=1 Tax=Irpex rosettiformis TaxID=378272 RepID=A0ACB8TT89_9APHY|nr:hypothetical protein BDY19DRAFT_996978 [Irpex rosettiformis]
MPHSSSLHSPTTTLYSTLIAMGCVISFLAAVWDVVFWCSMPVLFIVVYTFALVFLRLPKEVAKLCLYPYNKWRSSRQSKKRPPQTPEGKGTSS